MHQKRESAYISCAVMQFGDRQHHEVARNAFEEDFIVHSRAVQYQSSARQFFFGI